MSTVSKTPLLLLPGWGMGPRCWGPLADTLEDCFELDFLSLPGHGAWPADPGWTGAGLATRLLERAPGASWLAWSLGAQVALAAALQAPDQVKSLVLVGATPRFQSSGDWPHGMAPESFVPFRAACRQDPRATLRRFHGLQVQGSEHASSTQRALRAGQLEDPEGAVLDAGLAELARTDLREALDALQVPTLWISGEHDRVTPAAAALAASRRAPRARVSCVPGAGHAPFLSHPDLVSAAVRKFLDDPES